MSRPCLRRKPSGAGNAAQSGGPRFNCQHPKGLRAASAGAVVWLGAEHWSPACEGSSAIMHRKKESCANVQRCKQQEAKRSTWGEHSRCVYKVRDSDPPLATHKKLPGSTAQACSGRSRTSRPGSAGGGQAGSPLSSLEHLCFIQTRLSLALPTDPNTFKTFCVKV